MRLTPLHCFYTKHPTTFFFMFLFCLIPTPPARYFSCGMWVSLLTLTSRPSTALCPGPGCTGVATFFYDVVPLVRPVPQGCVGSPRCSLLLHPDVSYPNKVFAHCAPLLRFSTTSFPKFVTPYLSTVIFLSVVLTFCLSLSLHCSWRDSVFTRDLLLLLILPSFPSHQRFFHFFCGFL